MARDALLADALEVLDERLDRAEGDTRRAYAEITNTEREFIRGELEHCVSDFRYYAANYHWIRSKDDGVRLFDSWYESQEIFYANAMREIARCGNLQMAIMKARQLGISEVIAAWIFQRTIFSEGVNSLIVAQDPGQSDYLFTKYRFAYDSLPWWMRPDVRYEQKKALMEFDRPGADDRRTNPGLRSGIYVEAANKATGLGVGKGITNAHLSEICRWPPDGEALMVDLTPAFANHGLFAVLESTAYGEDHFWYKLWCAAVEGESSWTPLFIEAFRLKKYSIPVAAGVKFERTSEEIGIAKKVQAEKGVVLSDAFFNWRRITKRDFENANDGDDSGFFASYPSASWAEAFQNTGRCAFDRKKLQLMLETTEKSPIWAGEINLESGSSGLLPRLVGGPVSPGTRLQSTKHIAHRFRIWEEPQDGESYYIAVDSSLGLVGKDASAIEVFRIGRYNEPDEQVAEWHGWENTVETARIAYAIGSFYNEAQIAVEIDGIGRSTMVELYKNLEYPNPYRWQQEDKIRNSQTNYLGWQTTGRTRPLIIVKMREAIHTDAVIFHSRALITELKGFVSYDGFRFEAAGGLHDDLAMAAMICIYCAHQSDFGIKAASAPRKTRREYGRYMQAYQGVCRVKGGTMEWKDGDHFDPMWPPNVPVILGAKDQGQKLYRLACPPASSVRARLLGSPPDCEEIEFALVPPRADYYNTACMAGESHRGYDREDDGPEEFQADLMAHVAVGGDDAEDERMSEDEQWRRY